MDVNRIQKQAADALLDRGLRYEVSGEKITLRALRYGTLLILCSEVAASGLTLEAIEEGEKNIFDFFARYGELVLRCIAIAEINNRDVLDEEAVSRRVQFYKDNLSALQVYELFAQVINLSGIQTFTTTIRFLLTTKEANLSPRTEEGS